eukprot:gene479-1886_t
MSHSIVIVGAPPVFSPLGFGGYGMGGYGMGMPLGMGYGVGFGSILQLFFLYALVSVIFNVVKSISMLIPVHADSMLSLALTGNWSVVPIAAPAKTTDGVDGGIHRRGTDALHAQWNQGLRGSMGMDQNMNMELDQSHHHGRSEQMHHYAPPDQMHQGGPQDQMQQYGAGVDPGTSYPPPPDGHDSQQQQGGYRDGGRSPRDADRFAREESDRYVRDESERHRRGGRDGDTRRSHGRSRSRSKERRRERSRSHPSADDDNDRHRGRRLDKYGDDITAGLDGNLDDGGGGP